MTTATVAAPCCPPVQAVEPRPWRLFTPRVELRASILAGVLLLVGWVLTASGVGAAVWLVWASLAIGMVYGGRAALESVRELRFDIDVLMVVGAALAAYIGAPAEGALLLFLFVLSGALEDMAMERTRRAVEALHTLMPTAALRWDDRAGDWTQVEPEVLAAGDRIKILPGESIPTDAVLTVGESAVNQASLTGESIPRIVEPGDELYAGTINVGNPVEARVTRPAAESSLQRILNLVTQAQQQREPVQRIIDRFSQPYALGVMGASIVVLLVWRFVFNEPFLVREPGGGVGGALYTAITLLVVMSPCAVIISTPTATLAAIARAARGGVLFKGGQAIERLARLRAVAMDKTGTLTIGRPRVQRIISADGSDPLALLGIAAGLEQDSTHPIASAIREHAAAKGVEPRPIAASAFVPGHGLSGEVDGAPAYLGTLQHTEDLIDPSRRTRIREAVAAAQEQGQIATVIAWNGHAAVLVMLDEPRPGADTIVQRLHEVGVAPVVMLTGDNPATARHIAERLGIDRWHAEMMPEGKVAEVEALKAELRGAGRPGLGTRQAWGGVGLIGDGVNDAPALSAADVSIAIGSIGSDAALESADIVLLGEDLGTIPWAVALARRARQVIVLNLTFALLAIAAMAVTTLLGSRLGYQFPLWMGVIGHEGGTLLVVANSLTLLAFRRTTHSAAPSAAMPVERAEPVRGGGRQPAPAMSPGE